MKNKFFLELRLVEDERISFVWICRSENLLWPNVKLISVQFCLIIVILFVCLDAALSYVFLMCFAS